MSRRTRFVLATMTFIVCALATRSAFGFDASGAAARAAAIQATMARFGIALIKPPPLRVEIGCNSPSTAPAAVSVLTALSLNHPLGPH